MALVETQEGDNVIVAYSGAINITPASVATIVAVEQTFTAPDIPFGTPPSGSPVVIVSKSTAMGVALGSAMARVTAASQIGITFINPTGGALVPGAGVYNLAMFGQRIS